MLRRGQTPIIHVRGRSQRRISIAALTCYKPGSRSRLIYRPIVHPDHKTSRQRSFAWTDYRDLPIVAHQQLGKPIVLAWDNLNVHRDRRLREFVDTQANIAFTDAAHLMRALRRGLRQVQHRPDLIDGCLAGTGLTLVAAHIAPDEMPFSCRQAAVVALPHGAPRASGAARPPVLRAESS
ncbi:IS630 family transposase [Kitasatospora phosalacinea]|uniref:IS630 family transposase n=1 Tax=Kitasatospora phosalacinea TaxID=2065 RepID=UPI00365701B8